VGSVGATGIFGGSETSQLQYIGSCVAYVLSSSSLFIILTWLLLTNPEALEFLHFGAAEHLPPEVSKFAAPLIIALAMTTLLPSFPMLRELDAKLLRFFHRLGRIPIAATRWSKQMERAQFVISPRTLADIKTYISNSPVLLDDVLTELRTDPSDSARSQFTRNLALYVSLSNLDDQTRFAEDYPEETADFEKTIASYFAQSTGFFALTKQLAHQQLDPLPEPIKEARKGYKTLCHDVYEEIRLMLARGHAL
jgi:hypothetical protein